MIGIKKLKKYVDLMFLDGDGVAITKESAVEYDDDGNPIIVPVLMLDGVYAGIVSVALSRFDMNTREFYIDWRDPENIHVTMAYAKNGKLQKINKVFKSKP